MSFPPISAAPSTRRPQAVAEYVYDADHDQRLLSIIDLDQGEPTVTNDLVAVLADITHDEGLASLAGWGVTYRDTENEWSQVLLNAASRVVRAAGFGVRVTDEAEALRLLRERRA